MARKMRKTNRPYLLLICLGNLITRALMQAVPRRRKLDKQMNFKPIPSPIHPLNYQTKPSAYKKVDLGHFVLQGVWDGESSVDSALLA